MIKRFGIEYVTSSDAASRFHYCENHIQMLARLQKVGSIKVQGVIYINLAEMRLYATHQLEIHQKAQRNLRGASN